mmetsp:Transcript_24440/g.43354  ORF Transcript_24440/g.43354 Transcript_24440/m.43354 type:complete len:452 (-) Transcript_24440:609-1964(-)
MFQRLFGSRTASTMASPSDKKDKDDDPSSPEQKEKKVKDGPQDEPQQDSTSNDSGTTAGKKEEEKDIKSEEEAEEDGGVKEEEDGEKSPPASPSAQSKSASSATKKSPSKTSNSNNNNSKDNPPRGTGGQSLQFPWKLHEMLNYAEMNGKDDVISWLPGGKGFRVHKKEEFCEEVMPIFFASKKYKTFQRSLNLWGFESVSKGSNRGACYHDCFLKGRPELCHSMTRVKIKGQGSNSSGGAGLGGVGNSCKVGKGNNSGTSLSVSSVSRMNGDNGTASPGLSNPFSSSLQQSMLMGGDAAAFAAAAAAAQQEPSSISAFIRGKTAGEGHALALSAAAAANPHLAMLGGGGLLGGTGLPSSMMAGFPSYPAAAMGFGTGGLGMDPFSLYNAEILARRAALERHQAMTMAAAMGYPSAAELAAMASSTPRGAAATAAAAASSEKAGSGNNESS